MRDAPANGGINLPTECTGQYDTIVTQERAVQIRRGKNKTKKRKKEKREPEGWMNTGELRVKWLIKAPLAVLGPRRDGEGRSRSAVGGERGERRHSGLNRKLKAPGEPGAASSRFGFAGGRAPSAGCSSHGHLREDERGGDN